MGGQVTSGEPEGDETKRRVWWKTTWRLMSFVQDLLALLPIRACRLQSRKAQQHPHPQPPSTLGFCEVGVDGARGACPWGALGEAGRGGEGHARAGEMRMDFQGRFELIGEEVSSAS